MVCSYVISRQSKIVDRGETLITYYAGKMKRTFLKPQKQGRYWHQEPDAKAPKLVYVEQQALGLYVIGKGWLPWQTGDWSSLVGEGEVTEQQN